MRRPCCEGVRCSSDLEREHWEVKFAKLMHLKLAVIDQEVIILGSYNWTDPAERRNKETLEIKRSREYGERLIGNIDGIR